MMPKFTVFKIQVGDEEMHFYKKSEVEAYFLGNKEENLFDAHLAFYEEELRKTQEKLKEANLKLEKYRELIEGSKL